MQPGFAVVINILNTFITNIISLRVNKFVYVTHAQIFLNIIRSEPDWITSLILQRPYGHLNSVEGITLLPHTKLCIFITKTDLLMMFRKVNVIYCENRTNVRMNLVGKFEILSSETADTCSEWPAVTISIK